MDRKKIEPIDTLALSESLGVQTFRRGLRRPWTKDEDARLLAQLHTLYPQLPPAKDINWDAVARPLAPTRKPKDCRKRWLSLLDPRLRRGKWLAEEDQKLVELYARHGTQWQLVLAEIPGRTEHQCSKRYLEVLDPALRERLRAWTEAEDLELVAQVRAHGTKWRTVARALEGRPPILCPSLL